MSATDGLFQKSQLHQRVVWKFNHAIMVWRGGVFQERAVGVLTDLFRSQDFWRHLDANYLVFPVELVLLDVVKAIRLVINWRAEWRRRDLFLSRRIVERAVHDLVARLREHWHLGVPDVLSVSLRIEHDPILRRFFWVDLLLRNLEPNVQPSLSVALLRPHSL